MSKGSEMLDLLVIGGGSGGYVACLRAVQRGMRVACVDNREALGGTCLNEGCIPSKALLESSHRFQQAREEAVRHGIQTGEVKLDLAAMMARKDRVVRELTGGIRFLFKKKKEMDEKAEEDGEKEREEVLEEKKEEPPSYEELYGKPAPEIIDEDITTEELKKEIGEQIRKLEQMKEDEK